MQKHWKVTAYTDVKATRPYASIIVLAPNRWTALRVAVFGQLGSLAGMHKTAKPV